MHNPNIDSETPYEPESHNEPESHDEPDALLSLDAEIKEHLEDYYARIEFLEGTSAAIHDYLQHDFYSSSPGDEGKITSDAGNVTHDDSTNNQHYYEGDFDSGDADAEDYDDFQDEQLEDEQDEYEDWDGNDEYYD